MPAQQLTSPFTVSQPFTEPPRVPSSTFPSPGKFYRDKGPLPSDGTWHSWEEGEYDVRRIGEADCSPMQGIQLP